MKITDQAKNICHAAQVWQAIANTRDTEVGNKLFDELCVAVGPYIKCLPPVSSARSRVLGSRTWEMVDESDNGRLYRTPMAGIAQAAELVAIEDGAGCVVDEVGFVHLAEPLEEPLPAEYLYMTTHQLIIGGEWYVKSLATTLGDTKIDLAEARKKAAFLVSQSANLLNDAWEAVKAAKTEAEYSEKDRRYGELCVAMAECENVNSAVHRCGTLSRDELRRISSVDYVQLSLL